MGTEKDKERLLLFGATGPTGRLVIQEALSAGIHVTALARKPEALDDVPGRAAVDVLHADIFKPETIEAAFASSRPSIVVFAAGVPGPAEALKGTAIYSTAGPQIVRGMTRYGTGRQRAVVITSSGVDDDPTEPLVYRFFAKPLFFTQMYEDMRALEDCVVAGAARGAFSYVMVRPSFLVGLGSRPAIHPRAMRVCDGQMPHRASHVVGRGDVARFIVRDAALSDEWVSKRPVLSYPTRFSVDVDFDYAAAFGEPL